MKRRPSTCSRCGKRDDEVGRISWGRLCAKCGAEATLDAARQLNAKSGPVHDRWQEGMERAARERFGVPQRPGL